MNITKELRRKEAGSPYIVMTMIYTTPGTEDLEAAVSRSSGHKI